jgi:glycosyltransferase involved in cell wall biosynthesis
MRAGLPDGVAIMIYDNGSCAALTDWLREEYKPDTLILSPNIGKSNARAALVRMVKPEAIIATCDDDMLFYPGWWEANEQVLKIYPGGAVGKASCYPVRTQGRWGCDFTKAWAKGNGQLEVGRFITEEEDYDFCFSIGRDYAWHVENSITEMDYRVTYNGIQAYCFSHHCQFMAYAGKIARFCERVDSCMHDEKPFEIAIDQAGLLNLTTAKRYCRHIGNVLDPKVQKEFHNMGILEAVLC